MTQHYIKKGRRYVEANPFAGTDISVMIVGAVRYTLGRSSYSPSCAQDWCMDNWQQLNKNTRFIIMRDVMEWLGQRHEWVTPGTTDSAWPEQWRGFLRWTFVQDIDEAKAAARAIVWQRDRFEGVDEFFGVLE